MSLRKLENRLEEVKEELYMLHFAEASPEVYQQKRFELEYEIACLEEQIELEVKMRPFRVTLGIFVIIAVALMLYTVIVKH